MSERRISVFQTATCHALRFRGAKPAAYDELEAFCFFTRSLLAAQYLRMRSDIARRFAGVSR